MATVVLAGMLKQTLAVSCGSNVTWVVTAHAQTMLALVSDAAQTIHDHQSNHKLETNEETMAFLMSCLVQ